MPPSVDFLSQDRPVNFVNVRNAPTEDESDLDDSSVQSRSFNVHAEGAHDASVRLGIEDELTDRLVREHGMSREEARRYAREAIIDETPAGVGQGGIRRQRHSRRGSGVQSLPPVNSGSSTLNGGVATSLVQEEAHGESASAHSAPVAVTDEAARLFSGMFRNWHGTQQDRGADEMAGEPTGEGGDINEDELLRDTSSEEGDINEDEFLRDTSSEESGMNNEE